MSRAAMGILLLILSSCHDEKGLEINCRRQAIFDGHDECRDPGGYGSVQGVGISHYEPVFNPNNEDEIAYIELLVVGGQRVMKCNLSTGLKTVLVDTTNGVSQLEWGRQGRLVMRRSAQLVIFDENGRNQEVISIEGLCSYFSWSFDASRIAYLHRRERGLFYNLMVYDLDAKKTDSVFQYTSAGGGKNPLSWSSRNRLTLHTAEGIGWIDMDTYDYELVVRYEDLPYCSPTFRDFEWSSDGDLLFMVADGERSSSCFSGILSLDIRDGSIDKIKCNCKSKYYGSLDLSPSNDFLLTSRWDLWEDKSTNATVSNRKVTLLKVNGCDERIIVGDE